MNQQEQNISKSMLKSGATLGLAALLSIILLAGTWDLTADRIAEQRHLAVLASLNRILPIDSYDNQILDDYIEISAPGFFKHQKPVKIYRARKQGKAVSLVLQFTTADGYNGDIDLLVNIGIDGVIIGVEVTKHRETPGLGDDIESRRSDWINGFTGHSITNPSVKNWTVKRNGGYFDQFTGATISPRAVVKAVRRALEYERANRQKLFQLPSASPKVMQSENIHGVGQ